MRQIKRVTTCIEILYLVNPKSPYLLLNAFGGTISAVEEDDDEHKEHESDQ